MSQYNGLGLVDFPREPLPFGRNGQEAGCRKARGQEEGWESCSWNVKLN